MSDILTARIVQCQFKGSQKLYAYFTDDQTIAVGDKVLVVSPNGEYSNAVADPSGAIAGYLTLVTVAPAGGGRGWYFFGHVPSGGNHNSLWEQKTWPDQEQAMAAAAEWVKAEEAKVEEAKVAAREVGRG